MLEKNCYRLRPGDREPDSCQVFLRYAFTFFPFLVVYPETALFFGVFFVVLPRRAPAKSGNNGSGMLKKIGMLPTSL
jgi:hypothetical protein